FDFFHALARVAFLEQHLARQIRLFDHVAIDEHELTDARARQALRQRAAQRAAAHDQHARALDALLTARAQRRETRLALEAPRERRRVRAHARVNHHTSSATTNTTPSTPHTIGKSARRSLGGGSLISTQLK